jgi:hypothetical protein
LGFVIRAICCNRRNETGVFMSGIRRLYDESLHDRHVNFGKRQANHTTDWARNRCLPLLAAASIPLEHVRRSRDTPIWKLEAALKCRSCRTPRYSPPVHMIRLMEERQTLLYSGRRSLLRRPLTVPRPDAPKHSPLLHLGTPRCERNAFRRAPLLSRVHVARASNSGKKQEGFFHERRICRGPAQRQG